MLTSLVSPANSSAQLQAGVGGAEHHLQAVITGAAADDEGSVPTPAETVPQTAVAASSDSTAPNSSSAESFQQLNKQAMPCQAAQGPPCGGLQEHPATADLYWRLLRQSSSRSRTPSPSDFLFASSRRVTGETGACSTTAGGAHLVRPSRVVLGPDHGKVPAIGVGSSWLTGCEWGQGNGIRRMAAG